MSHYEAIGRLYVEAQGLRADYARLLSVLAAVKAGTVKPEHITAVDAVAQTWAVDIPAPAAPTTVQ